MLPNLRSRILTSGIQSNSWPWKKAFLFGWGLSRCSRCKFTSMDSPLDNLEFQLSFYSVVCSKNLLDNDRFWTDSSGQIFRLHGPDYGFKTRKLNNYLLDSDLSLWNQTFSNIAPMRSKFKSSIISKSFSKLVFSVTLKSSSIQIKYFVVTWEIANPLPANQPVSLRRFSHFEITEISAWEHDHWILWSRIQIIITYAEYYW